MEYFETEILPTITQMNWLRYVDDIFLYIENDRDFENFLIILNEVHPNIKFKYEIEDNNKCLPFLDLLIHRE